MPLEHDQRCPVQGTEQWDRRPDPGATPCVSPQRCFSAQAGGQLAVDRGTSMADFAVRNWTSLPQSLGAPAALRCEADLTTALVSKLTFGILLGDLCDCPGWCSSQNPHFIKSSVQELSSGSQCPAMTGSLVPMWEVPMSPDCEWAWCGRCSQQDMYLPSTACLSWLQSPRLAPLEEPWAHMVALT